MTKKVTTAFSIHGWDLFVVVLKEKTLPNRRSNLENNLPLWRSRTSVGFVVVVVELVFSFADESKHSRGDRLVYLLALLLEVNFVGLQMRDLGEKFFLFVLQIENGPFQLLFD